MKRSISIILVALVLMNVMGYYGLLVGLQYRNTQNLVSRINAGTYAETETRSLKIPLPGNPGSETYDRIDGEFVHDGQVFRLVKQRLYKDTFHIVFIKDERGTLIRHALADYARSFSEKTQDDEQQLIILPVFIREYLSGPSKISETSGRLVTDVVKYGRTSIFLDSFVSRIIHPPQLA